MDIVELRGISSLVNFLAHNNSIVALTALDIGDEGTRYIAELLQQQHRVLEINLYSNSTRSRSRRSEYCSCDQDEFYTRLKEIVLEIKELYL
jgi:hypothetical protein